MAWPIHITHSMTYRHQSHIWRSDVSHAFLSLTRAQQRHVSCVFPIPYFHFRFSGAISWIHHLIRYLEYTTSFNTLPDSISWIHYLIQCTTSFDILNTPRCSFDDPQGLNLSFFNLFSRAWSTSIDSRCVTCLIHMCDMTHCISDMARRI